MKVSVIIPVFNESRAIVACLTSLTKQTKSHELIIVDDGSTDDTLELVKNLSQRLISLLRKKSEFKDLRLLEQKHLGPGAARNLGASQAKGEILMFVDSDMTFAPDFIEKLIEPIDKRLSKGTFTTEEYVSNWENSWARCWNYNLNLSDKRRLPVDYPSAAPVFRAILKSEYKRVGGFTSGVGWTDDWTLAEKLGYAATKTQAVCYHANPATPSEVFIQARWIGKNKFLSGSWLRIFFNTGRYSLPMTLIVGVVKSIIYKEPIFLIFKLAYDMGINMGLVSSLTSGDRNK